MQSNNDRDRRKEFFISHIKEVCQEVKSWAQEENWETREDNKLMSEDNIGNYEVPTLSVKTPNGWIKIEPIGTACVGMPERIDIRSLSTSKKLLLVRDNNNWVLRDGPESDWQQPWGREAFFNIVNDLTSN